MRHDKVMAHRGEPHSEYFCILLSAIRVHIAAAQAPGLGGKRLL